MTSALHSWRVLRGEVLGKALAVTDLKAHLTGSNVTEDEMSNGRLSERLTTLEPEAGGYSGAASRPSRNDAIVV